jgi:hypothetical protein
MATGAAARTARPPRSPSPSRPSALPTVRSSRTVQSPVINVRVPPRGGILRHDGPRCAANRPGRARGRPEVRALRLKPSRIACRNGCCLPASCHPRWILYLAGSPSHRLPGAGFARGEGRGGKGDSGDGGTRRERSRGAKHLRRLGQSKRLIKRANWKRRKAERLPPSHPAKGPSSLSG